MLKIQILQRVQIHLRWILTNLESRKTNLNWKMHQVLHSSLLRRHLWTNNWHITSLVKFKFVAMPFSANINKKDTQIIFIAKFPAFQTFNVRLAKNILLNGLFHILCWEIIMMMIMIWWWWLWRLWWLWLWWWWWWPRSCWVDGLITLRDDREAAVALSMWATRTYWRLVFTLV